MKRLGFLLLFLSASVLISSCGQDKNNSNNAGIGNEASIPDNVKIEQAVTDSLYAAVNREIENEVSADKDSIIAEAFTAVAETQGILNLLEENKTEEAVSAAHKLIGKLEVLLTKDPSTEFILADVSFRKNELITDIETVREIVKSAKKSMSQGYYQEAAELLKGLKSEIIITDYYIPLATYPDAVKLATALAEENKIDEAKVILRQLPSTIVATETILPLPVLKAEQMIVEASKTDAESHESSDKVLNLLDAADYQLQLAEEMGYGNKDKDFKVLTKSIEVIKKSVKDKSDSQPKFDSLKKDILKFKERLFPRKDKKDIK